MGTSAPQETLIYLDPRTLEKLRGFLEAQPEVAFAALFGSLASKGSSAHDVDIAVKLAGGDKYATLSRILDGVAQLLGLDYDYIDLVDLDRTDPALKRRVIAYGIVLVDRGYAREIIEELSRVLPEYDKHLRLSIREWLASGDPASVDLEVVKRRIDFIKSETEFLEEHVLSKSPTEVESSPMLRRLLERSYQLIIEAILDVCRHIASTKGWSPCFTARDFIEKCRDHGVIDAELASKLLEALKLRNVIVHRYMDVDYGKLYTEAGNLVKLAKDFERQLIAFLRGETR